MSRAPVEARSHSSADEGRKKSSFVERFRSGMSVAEPLRRWSSSRTGLAQPQLVHAQEEGGVAPRDGTQASAPALLEAVTALDRPGCDASVAALREPAVDPPPGSAAPARDARSSTERGRDLISSGAHLVGSSTERGRAAARGARREARLKVAIVLMTRRPHRFDFWLSYHRSLGVSHFFVLRPGRPEPRRSPSPYPHPHPHPPPHPHPIPIPIPIPIPHPIPIHIPTPIPDPRCT